MANYIADYSNYLEIERRASDNTVASYVRDVTQFSRYLSEEEGTDLAWFDPKWTGEALWNLLDNAIKYTFEGDTVLIQGRAYELFYRIDVVDHGKGIPEEDIPKIFQRFYRSSKNREEEGVGLGLYLAREIIQAQGGYMKVTSGKETVFSIFLLRREEAFHTELDHGAKAE